MVWAFVASAYAQGDANRGQHGGQSSLHDTISVVQLRVPEKARDQLMKALGEFGKEHLDQSLQHSNAALAIYADFPNALTLRGYIYLRQQHFDLAQADLAHSIQVDPSFELAYLYYGATMNRVGKYDEALLSLNRYEEANPKSWEAPYEVAKSWLGKHDYQRQLDAVNRASARGADGVVGPAIHFLRGRALAGLHQYATARSELQASITPETSSTMSTLAREILSVMDREAALAAK